MTRKQLRDTIRINLEDASITYYSDDEINASIQDAYNEICAKTRCLINSATKSWINNKTYYQPAVDLSLSDYLSCIAIFNNNTHMWLDDSLSLRDFDNVRSDWEICIGEPKYWAPHSFDHFAIMPKQSTASGTFTIWYWATAPTLSSDESVPLIATDVHDLIIDYCTGDLLETAEEIVKAKSFWSEYYTGLNSYKIRCSNLAKSELLLRI